MEPTLYWPDGAMRMTDTCRVRGLLRYKPGSTPDMTDSGATVHWQRMIVPTSLEHIYTFGCIRCCTPAFLNPGAGCLPARFSSFPHNVMLNAESAIKLYKCLLRNFLTASRKLLQSGSSCCTGSAINIFVSLFLWVWSGQAKPNWSNIWNKTWLRWEDLIYCVCQHWMMEATTPNGNYRSKPIYMPRSILKKSSTLAAPTEADKLKQSGILKMY